MMTPMQLSFAASTDENNAEGSTETITVYKLTDSTTPCSESNGTTVYRIYHKINYWYW